MPWLACFLWVLLVGILLGILLSRLLGYLYDLSSAGQTSYASGGSIPQQPKAPSSDNTTVSKPCLQTWFDNPSLKSIVGLPDVSADTLVAVLGIDPKVADVLADNGIKTLFDLASTSPKLLQFIITRSGFDSPKAPTDSWPRQAQYIVENRLDDLKQYRATLNS
jgi:predicted flap endonuclease-1-like 5' DNA nuclease